MCRKELGLHENGRVLEFKRPKIKRMKVSVKRPKKQVKQDFPSYSGKDEYDYEQEAQLFFLQNEDVLY